MPVAGAGSGKTPANDSRQTYKPPWVKEAPPPIPMPSQPWTKSTRPENKVLRKGKAQVVGMNKQYDRLIHIPVNSKKHRQQQEKHLEESAMHLRTNLRGQRLQLRLRLEKPAKSQSYLPNRKKTASKGIRSLRNPRGRNRKLRSQPERFPKRHKNHLNLRNRAKNQQKLLKKQRNPLKKRQNPLKKQQNPLSPQKK